MGVPAKIMYGASGVMSKRQRLYWDSCNFISLISEDEIQRADICQHILEDAEDGSVEIVTSALTIAEVIKPKGSPTFTAQKEHMISSFFLHEYILIHDVTRAIAENARKLSMEHGLKPRDAIHLATALAVDGVEVFQTWDAKDFSELDVPIRIGVPTWTGTLRMPLDETL